MRVSSALANLAIERVLELSADTHIERRMTAKDSPAFHNLTGAIVAYGKALRLLVALREREEFYSMIAELELLEAHSGLVH
jgi:diacylglycerol kinase